MSKKSRERRKERAEGKDSTPAKPQLTPDALRRRRNRRYLFIGVLAISFPILETIAYQFRAITITIINRSDVALKRIKVIYSGGEFDSPELKPGGSLSRLIRPAFNFKSEQFSTYTLSIRFATEDGQIFGQMGRVGALDYSAQEIYTVVQTPTEGHVELQHTTRPGFPLSLVRDLLERLGIN